MTARARPARWLLAGALAAAALPALRGVPAQTAPPPASGADPAATAEPAAGTRGARGRPGAGPAPGATERQPAARGAAEPPPALPRPAPRADRWRFNAHERTARGLDAWEKGEFTAADAAFRRALALAPGAGDARTVDPLPLLNAGTGRLAAGDPGEAARLLAAAAERAGDGDPDLATAARYNLGNARYAAGDYAAAADAYREVLRGTPEHVPAKHNLELALRRLAEQRRRQAGDGERRPDQQGSEGGESEEDDRGESEGEGESEPSGEPPEAGGAPRPQQDGPPDPGTAPQPRPEEEPGGDGDRRDRPLPGFEDQPDMTAEQAAAILEAVESLERQRRRAAAEERARRTAGGRDW